MSQQSSREQPSAGPSSAANEVESGITHPRLQPRASSQPLQIPLVPRQSAVPSQRGFRAPGVDAILTASERYALQNTTQPSVEPGYASTASKEMAWGGVGNVKHQPPGGLNQLEASRRTSQNLQRVLGGSPDTQPPREPAPSDVKAQGRPSLNSPYQARSTSFSHGVRGQEASAFERPVIRQGGASTSNETSPFSLQATTASGYARPASGGTLPGLGGGRITERERSLGRNMSDDYSTSGGESIQLSQPQHMEPGTRYMTLQTEQGPMSFPVDVQAASRGADEKRKRNAGASARFRARRKEREQANSREIDELRQTIRDLGEEVEFYRRERDYMVSALLQAPDRDRHFPRPSSPRRRRLSLQSNEPDLARAMSIVPGTPSLYQERGERGSMERNSRQRLAGEFSFSGPPTAISPSSQSSYRRGRSFSSQPGFATVQPMTQPPPGGSFVRSPEHGPMFSPSQISPIQDSRTTRGPSRTYPPSSSRGGP